MKGIVNAYTNVPLILRIVIGLAIGVILALVVPNNEWIAFLGTMFTSALKAIAPILVFFLVMGALSTARSAGNMKTVIILYIASTVVAGILAVIASFAFPSELVLTGIEAADTEAAPEELGTVITTLLLNGLSNPIGSLASANYLGIL
ncbi:MAG: cation:dicarboxylase symporter family transporter, partial [Coriobacteriaceae bacterium]|nr:cation:dicarboxylase symporter family transporter [Coriobacteriaceae bacterium]